MREISPTDVRTELLLLWRRWTDLTAQIRELEALQAQSPPAIEPNNPVQPD